MRSKRSCFFVSAIRPSLLAFLLSFHCKKTSTLELDSPWQIELLLSRICVEQRRTYSRMSVRRRLLQKPTEILTLCAAGRQTQRQTKYVYVCMANILSDTSSFSAPPSKSVPKLRHTLISDTDINIWHGHSHFPNCTCTSRSAPATHRPRSLP